MASAGRILIMPKGDYDSSTTYEMLDLVKHNGTSWLAKKTVVGIEPNETNAEYWHKLVDIDDVSADSIGAIARSGYGYYYGNVDELKTSGTYCVATFADGVSGTYPLPSGYWYTVIVSVGGTGSTTQDWFLATEPNVPMRRFTRHCDGTTWSPYFESVNANNGAFASDITLQKANNGKTVISKNHSDSADYGTFVKDVLADGTSAKLIVSASTGNEADALGFSYNDNGYYRVFGEHNTAKLIEVLTNAGFGGSSSGLQIATGSYVGTGSYGDSNKNSLTFNFEPKVVIITTGTTFNGACVWHYGAEMISMQVVGTTSSHNIFFTQSGNTLSWYNASQPSYQLNDASMTYHWVAIG